MKRLAVVSVVLLAGCAEAFRGHQEVVARAAGQELTVERLASLLGPAKQVPLRREIIDRVAEMWVDYQLLAQALASGDSMMDSATVEAANWPIVAQLLANRLHDSLIVARARPSVSQVDSAYAGNDHRYLYHILVSARQDTSEALRARARRDAEGYLAQLRRGAEFQQLARRVSGDSGSGRQGGSLGMVGRGVTVRPFEDAGFALAPGALSDVVETAFGFHIIWRPLLEVVRDSFAADLEEILVGQLDSAYLDSLSNRTGIRVRGSAPALVRRVAEDIRGAKERSRVLATYRGGRLRERDFARWLQAFPAQTRGMVIQAPDSTLSEFVRSITRNEMLVSAAIQRGITLSAQDRDSIRAVFGRDLLTLTHGMGVAPESLATGIASGQPAAAVAARQVDAYFTDITGSPSRRRYYEVPPFLADLLRDRGEWAIYPTGVDRALERSVEVRGPETPDPMQGMGNQMQPAPRVRPAPGGPPVGN
jgi:hypothetical protein